jgi:hypothetical protein
MSQTSREDQVWLLHGLTGSECGILKFGNGRLSFTADDGRRVFDAAPSELKDVKYPFLSAGAGVNFKIGSESYRLSFIQPSNTSLGEYASIPDARALGKAWKPILESGAS